MYCIHCSSQQQKCIRKTFLPKISASSFLIQQIATRASGSLLTGSFYAPLHHLHIVCLQFLCPNSTPYCVSSMSVVALLKHDNILKSKVKVLTDCDKHHPSHYQQPLSHYTIKSHSTAISKNSVWKFVQKKNRSLV